MPFLRSRSIKTSVYIDGFNFYYSAVKRTPYKWLDLKLLCEKVLQRHHDICAVHYFTARVSDTPNDPGLSSRQSVYLRALEAYIPEFQVHFGNFMRHERKMPLISDPTERIGVIHTEEKGSDVNLAVHLLNDAWHDRFECGVVISNDSDLAEAIKLTRENGKKVGVITTLRRPTFKLMNEATFYRRIKVNDLKKCLLPDNIPGTTIRKPDCW